MKLNLLLTCAMLAGCTTLTSPDVKNTEKIKKVAYKNDFLVAGYLENVTIANGSIKTEAKLDTGADNCSIHATDIVELEKDGKKWVRFNVEINKVRTTLTRKLIKITHIKRHGSEDQKRYVVKLDMKLGPVNEEVNFSLTDRSKFSVPVLIGRNYLNGNVIVDSSQKHTLEEK